MTEGTLPKSVELVGELCTGCGSCEAVCPQMAVTMLMDAVAGFYRPVINKNRCTNCGLCSKICPGVEVNFLYFEQSVFGRARSDQLLGVYEKCYVGHTLDQELRFKASSGGLTTELLRTALEKQLVDGVATATIKINPNGELQTIPYIARTPGELMAGIGSKYTPVAMNTSVREIIRLDGRYAVVGLPCHIHAIRKMQDAIPLLRKRIILCIGLFCAKNIRITGTYYLFNKLKIDRKELSSLSYRGQGWPGGMTILRNGRNSMFLPIKEYYKPDFDAFTIPRCSLCCDQTNELADIAFGDAWHIVKDDQMGSSVVIARNKTGLELIDLALRFYKVNLTQIDRNDIVRAQGGFRYKKRDIVGRLALCRLAGKKVPAYIGVSYTPSNITTYLSALSVSLKMNLSTRKPLWPVLNLYCSLIDKIR